jgi:hypothetical protein
MADSERTFRLPALWPLLLLSVPVAICVNLGKFHRMHHGDSILPILVSLQRWTLFFWDQDRVGMLVPLLAMPFKNPLVNLLVQEAIYIFCSLATLFLLARYVLRDWTYPLVGMLSAALFFVAAPRTLIFDFTAGTFYSVWFALGLGGLLLVETRHGGTSRSAWRIVLAVALLTAAHWVNASAALLLGPLLAFRALFCRDHAAMQLPEAGTAAVSQGGRWRARLRYVVLSQTSAAFFCLSVGFVGGILLMSLAPEQQTDLDSLPVGAWPKAWRHLLRNAWQSLSPFGWPRFLVGAAAVGTLLLVIPRVRRHASPPWRAAGALAAAAGVYFLFLGTRHWMVVNGYCARYSLPAIILLQAALVIVGVAPLCAALPARGRKGLYFLAAPFLLLAPFYQFGIPSIARVRTDLDRNLGACTKDILNAGCTHVAGDYWKVWSSVFHANLVLYERGEERMVWGLSNRSGPTVCRWQGMPWEEMRVAVPLAADLERDYYWTNSGVPSLVVAEERPTVWILRPEAGRVYAER